LANIDVRTDLVIEKIKMDDSAKRELDAMWNAYTQKVPFGQQRGRSDFEAAAKSQGYGRAGKVEPNELQKIFDASFKESIKNLSTSLSAATKQSKILTMVLDTIQKAFGLLIDLILIPFVPLITWALINLFKAVMYLGRVWADFVKVAFPSLGGKEQSLGSPGGKGHAAAKDWGLDALIEIIAPVLVGLLIAAILVAIGVSAGWALIAGAIVALLTMYLVQKAYVAGEAFAAWLNVWLSTVDAQLNHFYAVVGEFVSQVSKAVSDAIAFIVSIYENTKVILGDIFALWDGFINTIAGGLKAIANGFIALINAILGSLRSLPGVGAFVPGDIPYLDTGGFIQKTGLAVVHQGETVVPAGVGGSSSGNTFNFYGYQDDQFIRKVREVTRQDATRYAQ
jgi:hypothetical protein